MPLYELLCLARPLLARGELQQMIHKVGGLVYSKGGVVTDVVSYGKQPLAYKIKGVQGKFDEVRFWCCWWLLLLLISKLRSLAFPVAAGPSRRQLMLAHGALSLWLVNAMQHRAAANLGWLIWLGLTLAGRCSTAAAVPHAHTLLHTHTNHNRPTSGSWNLP